MKLLRVAVVACALAPAAAHAQSPAPKITVAPPSGIKPQLQPVVVPGPTPVPKVVAAPPVTVTPPVATGKPSVFPKAPAAKPGQFPKSPAVAFPKVPAGVPSAFPKAPAAFPKAPALTPLDEPKQGLGAMTEQQKLQQNQMQMESRKFQTLSNAVKGDQEASEATIRNLK